jgi:tetratricopeptide (TPR) repeat protein
MGFEYIDEASGRLDAVRFRLDGYKVTLFDQPNVLELFSAFAGNGEASKVNAWNQARRSGRAYLDDSSSFVIEADLDLTRGVTRDTVETFIRQFPVTVRAYADFLGNPISVDFDLRTITNRQQVQNADEATQLQITPSYSDILSPKAREVMETAERQISEMDKQIEGLNTALADMTRMKDQKDTVEVGTQAIRAKQFDVAVTSFTRASEIDSNSAPVWALLAQAYLGLAGTTAGSGQQQALSKGAEAYRRAIALKPDDAALHHGYAFALARANRFDEAQTELTTAARLDPSNAGKYYFTLGAAMLTAGRKEEALGAFKRAADAGYADANYHYGVLLATKAVVGSDRRVTPLPGTVEAFLKYLQLVPNGENVGRACTTLFMLNAAPAGICQNKISLPRRPTDTSVSSLPSQPATTAVDAISGQQQTERPSAPGQDSGTSAVVHQRVQSATTRIRAPFGEFAIWIDPYKWRQTPSDRQGWLQFRHTTGAGIARVVTEARRLSTEEVLQVASTNLRSIDLNIRVTLQEKRTVNGHELVALRADGTMDKVPVTFYSYLYGGTSGNIQVLTVTPSSAFPQNADELTNFLDGIEVPDQQPAKSAAPSVGFTPTADILPTAVVTSAPPHYKSPSATTRIKAPFGDFAIWIDSSEWRQVPSDAPGTLEFNAMNGEGFAKVITERLGVRTEALPKIALTMAKNADPNMRISLWEKRVVNGHELIALQLEGTVKSIPIKYYDYYYGGTSGTLQVMTFTTASAFDRQAEAFTRFLDGIEISDQALPPSTPSPTASTETSRGMVTFNGDTMQVVYDQRRWQQSPSTQPGRFQFAHTKGDAVAMVISERLAVPFDALPDIALSNARSTDPGARITVKEKRNVGGVDVWFLRIEAEPKNIPFTFLGYYYSGGAGTVQIITYTGRNLISEYEKDFMAFLNGFSVTSQ